MYISFCTSKIILKKTLKWEFSCFYFYEDPNVADNKYNSEGPFQKAHFHWRFSETNFIILELFLRTLIQIKNTKRLRN